MKTRTKAVLTLIGVGGLIAFAATAASAAPAKKRPITDDELDDEEDEEISVTLPGADGVTGTGPEIEVSEGAAADSVEVDDEDEQVEEVLPTDEPPAPDPDPKPAPAPKNALEAASNKPKGVTLDEQAAEVAEDTGASTADVVDATVNEITQGESPTPLTATETSKEMDPDGTIKLARLMLAREEAPGWKSDMQEDVGEWQDAVGLTKDGKFGPKSVAKMAEEVGLLPLVRYWPKSVRSKQEAKTLYGRNVRAVIMQLENERPLSDAHIAALYASVDREAAQSFGTSNPPPQDTLEWISDVTEAIGDDAEDAGEQELES